MALPVEGARADLDILREPEVGVLSGRPVEAQPGYRDTGWGSQAQARGAQCQEEAPQGSNEGHVPFKRRLGLK